MKYVIDAVELKRVAQLASSMVASRSPRPILECVRVDMSATPPVMQWWVKGASAYITHTLASLRPESVTKGKPGSAVCVVPAATLAKIVAAMPTEGVIGVDGDGAGLRVREGDAEYVVAGFEPKEWPRPAPHDDKQPLATFVQTQAVWTLMLDAASCVTPVLESKEYNVAGVRCQVMQASWRLSATDGISAVAVKASLSGRRAKDIHVEAVIPSDVVRAVRSVLQPLSPLPVRLVMVPWSDGPRLVWEVGEPSQPLVVVQCDTTKYNWPPVDPLFVDKGKAAVLLPTRRLLKATDCAMVYHDDQCIGLSPRPASREFVMRGVCLGESASRGTVEALVRESQYADTKHPAWRGCSGATLGVHGSKWRKMVATAAHAAADFVELVFGDTPAKMVHAQWGRTLESGDHIEVVYVIVPRTFDEPAVAAEKAVADADE